MTAHGKLVFASVLLTCACGSSTPEAPAPAPARKAPPRVAVVTPEPDESDDPRPRHCAVLDLDAWLREFETAAAEARPALLAELGLQASDPNFLPEAGWPAAIHLRSVRLHQFELGGPPGVEQIVEIELAGTENLDDTHARSVVQVFTAGEKGELCRVLDEGELSASLVGHQRPAFANPESARPWGPQAIAFVELLAPGVHVIERWTTTGDNGIVEEAEDRISYWALDEHGELEEIFQFKTFSRRVNHENGLPLVEFRGEVQVLEGGWPRMLETKVAYSRQFEDEQKVEHSTREGRWKFDEIRKLYVGYSKTK